MEAEMMGTSIINPKGVMHQERMSNQKIA